MLEYQASTAASGGLINLSIHGRLQDGRVACTMRTLDIQLSADADHPDRHSVYFWIAPCGEARELHYKTWTTGTAYGYV